MKIEETHNIHKNLNSIFPFFKSKWLCNKGLHNYQIHSKTILMEPIIEKDGYNIILKVPRKHILYWKCACCEREEKFG